jgi:magnesium and cobalt exporter, CNNM family
MLSLLKILFLAALVGLNAFFVAAEYSLLSVRKTRLDQLVGEGNARARLLRHMLADTGQLFSGIQLGVTVSSLLMGWIGEHIVADAIEGLLAGHLYHYASLAIAHSVALGIAFLCVTLLLMVLGELAPKTLAYERAEHVALAVAGPLSVFLRLSQHPVNLLDRLSRGVVRAFGSAPPKHHGPQHTPEEVKLIVSAIRQRGLLEEEQEEMIQGVFELDRVRVSEIMVPWPKVTCLPVTNDLRVLLNQVVKDQHSRIPIYDGSPDHIIGVLYTKDLLALILERQRNGVSLEAPFDIHGLLHPPMTVPEAMPLNQMLEEARVRRAQMALVVDEFGTFVGLVTLEDVLEEIVGEIEDEYDREERGIHRVSDSVLWVDAGLGLRELADDYGIALPRGVGYETLAGFVLDRLGSIPRGGETFVFEGRRYTVMEMDGRRVARVRVEKLRQPAAARTAEQAAAEAPARRTNR